MSLPPSKCLVLPLVPPQVVKLDILMEAVTEASYMLGLLCNDDILNLKPSLKSKSRSSKKARVALTSMKSFHLKGGDLGVILADVPKCERNCKPTKHQCVVRCLSYGIYDCSKTFCVSNNWWDKCHWGHHLKRLHEEGNTEINTLKMADNHLRNFHRHHLHRYGDKIFFILTLRT